jgi:hypothetical protein
MWVKVGEECRSKWIVIVVVIVHRPLFAQGNYTTIIDCRIWMVYMYVSYVIVYLISHYIIVMPLQVAVSFQTHSGR